MASYPTPKVHRRSRRKLGRGQYPAIPAANPTVTGAGSTVTVTYDQPVIVSGPIGLTVGALTNTTQTVVSPTVVTVLLSGPLTGLDWSLAANPSTVATSAGGGVAGASGSF
jgi:hypothetical protein